MKVVLLREGFKFKTSLGSQTNFLQNLTRLMMIQCLILCPKIEKVLIHKARSLLVDGVVRNMWLNVLLGMILQEWPQGEGFPYCEFSNEEEW